MKKFKILVCLYLIMWSALNVLLIYTDELNITNTLIILLASTLLWLKLYEV